MITNKLNVYSDGQSYIATFKLGSIKILGFGETKLEALQDLQDNLADCQQTLDQALIDIRELQLKS